MDEVVRSDPGTEKTFVEPHLILARELARGTETLLY